MEIRISFGSIYSESAFMRFVALYSGNPIYRYRSNAPIFGKYKFQTGHEKGSGVFLGFIGVCWGKEMQ